MCYRFSITKMMSLIFMLMAQMNIASYAQGVQQKMTIGDKAPEIKYGKWIKGTPIKTYEKGRLYLFEFWATWCGPCIASMPHLSEFAREHKDIATIIAVNIWEGSHGDTSKKYDSYLPKVTRFVNNMKDKMDFNVIMDNNSQHMGNNWMKAAGQGGIPCTFIVKDGIIQWIGHPIELDSIVKVVLDKNYDVAGARKAALEKSKEAEGGGNSFAKIHTNYQAAMDAKEYDKAIGILDEAINNNNGENGAFGFFKFQTMMEHGNEDSAMAFVRKWQESKPGFTGSAGAVIVNKKGLKKESYQYGIALAESLLQTPQIPTFVYKLMATGYANMGDYAKAVQIQQKGIDIGKAALKEGKYAGFVTDDSIAEDEKVLAEYKKNLK